LAVTAGDGVHLVSGADPCTPVAAVPPDAVVALPDGATRLPVKNPQAADAALALG